MIPRPRVLLRPKERLPKGRSVTIALGMISNHGLVLCADTQHTISGYIKTYDGKVDLHLYRDPWIAVAIAGAGTDDYIVAAQQFLLRNAPDGKNVFEIEASLKAKCLSFFDEHLARWAYYPERERPTVELLIGVTGKNLYPRLFHYAGTAFQDVRGAKAIGDGVLLANDLITGATLGNYTVNQLCSFGIYVVAKVKRGVDGCGGSTHVVALRKGFDFAFTDQKEVDKLEQEISEMEKVKNRELIDVIVAKPLAVSWQSEHRKTKAKRLTAQKSAPEP